MKAAPPTRANAPARLGHGCARPTDCAARAARPGPAAGLLVTVAALVLLAPESAWALCAMCINSLKNPEAQGLASAFRKAILFLLAFPVATIATVAFLIIREQTRARLAGETSKGAARTGISEPTTAC